MPSEKPPIEPLNFLKSTADNAFEPFRALWIRFPQPLEAVLKLPLLFVGILLAANSIQLGDAASRARYLEEDVRSIESLSQRSVEPGMAHVVPGSRAPNFSYQTPDAEWRTLNDLLEQGAVLLVMAPDNESLTAIERDRERLLDMGVIPVAVVKNSISGVKETMKDMKLHYTVIPDLREVIAEQFNCLHPETQDPVPGWFILDRRGQVRALDRTGLPENYTVAAAKALSIPLPGVPMPAAH